MSTPMHALPLDIFRVLTGVILFCYFLQSWRQAGDFSDPDGLIDHKLLAKLVPPIRWGLFQVGMPGGLFRAVYLGGCLASLFVVVGLYPRVAALFLFLAAVSAYRWNVLVAYLDDAMIHIMCLWLVLLPVGGTLNLPDLFGMATTSHLGTLTATAKEWLNATVPGTAPRAFLANMALIYLVAGLYKFTSPMWRNGSAMHAALKMPIAHAPDFWTLRFREPLRIVTWVALVLEPLFVLIYLLPTNSTAKWLLAAGAVAYHAGVVATLKIPYSNLAMLAALPVAFGPEIAQIGLGASAPVALAVNPGLGTTEVAALALVVLLTLSALWEAARIRCELGRPYFASRWRNPGACVLWLVGVFQSYRLFDWVDARNYHVRYKVFWVKEMAGQGGAGNEPMDRYEVNPNQLFPDSMRHLLLQSYLIGNVWLQLEEGPRDAVRRSLLTRYAQRFAQQQFALQRPERHQLPNGVTIKAEAIVQRVTADNLELTKGEKCFLMRFKCRDGEAIVDQLG